MRGLDIRVSFALARIAAIADPESWDMSMLNATPRLLGATITGMGAKSCRQCSQTNRFSGTHGSAGKQMRRCATNSKTVQAALLHGAIPARFTDEVTLALNRSAYHGEHTMNTATILSIEQLERAINIWRSRRPSRDGDPILCREARILADPYALMIFHGATQIDAAKLTDDQRAAYNGAFTL
ncbi:hypothetical protein J2785_007021 [Burkholderia ambifaria]|nr:hypothetical protein [Burkholderia ambifaria]